MLLPRRNVWLDLTAVASTRDGLVARAELGHRFSSHAVGFIAGQMTPRDARAEAGIRLTY